FANTQVPTGGNFTASFIYQAGGTRAADGFGFVLQQQTPTAVGGGGGAKAYSGITPSWALLFNIFVSGSNVVGTTVTTNGNSPADTAFDAVLPVNLAGGNQIAITVVYNASAQTVTVTLTELGTANTFTRTYTGINLASILGGNSAWVGFTGATGGSVAIQT